MVISKPLRSAMSKLFDSTYWGSHEMRGNVPIEIVIQDLNGRRLCSCLNLFRDRDKHRWIWLPDEVTGFPFPLECVSEIKSDKMEQKDENGPLTDSSQQNVHLKVSVPVDLNSTALEGL